MLHWHASSAAGLVLTWRYRPVCAAVWGLPDCAPRRAFGRAMEMVFHHPEHCRVIRDTYLIGWLLRG